ncbi:hypothetical protein [Tsukamurella pseudospumae]|uniref:Uncharacterized protein n=1 Tax=Tsukamurella pseudospumae TaxID=239498 RepID=A0A138AU05_9ACTN|nr:hypothetical protein [Tsukamurella pseudospumae]KXP13914.1 hypothetical protein AXK60_22690 [Tsukamurella pseudospumae]
MSSTAPDTPADHLTPVTDAARILGGSPALYVALLRGGIIEGSLIDGEWHVDTGTVGAALAVRGCARSEGAITRATCDDAAQGHPARMVGGAA